jgi:hypothetical protein
MFRHDYFRILLDYTRWRTNQRTPGIAYFGSDKGNTVSAQAQVAF